jgi:cytochrome c5
MNKSTMRSTYSYHIMTTVLVLFIGAGFVTAKAEELDNSMGDVARGATSWAQNCARCHEMRDPAEFRDDLWRPIVAHMRIRAGLTGQQQRDILAFLQSANNPAPKAVKVSSTIAADNNSGPALTGKEIYGKTCIACHGANGTGTLPGAPDFTKLDGPLSKSDEILVQHITEGFQSPGSPMAMPAKGGDSSLTAVDVQAVLSYMRETF